MTGFHFGKCVLPLKMTINRTIFNGFLMAFLMGAINGILMGLYAVVIVRHPNEINLNDLPDEIQNYIREANMHTKCMTIF